MFILINIWIFCILYITKYVASKSIVKQFKPTFSYIAVHTPGFNYFQSNKSIVKHNFNITHFESLRGEATMIANTPNFYCIFTTFTWHFDWNVKLGSNGFSHSFLGGNCAVSPLVAWLRACGPSRHFLWTRHAHLGKRTTFWLGVFLSVLTRSRAVRYLLWLLSECNH